VFFGLTIEKMILIGVIAALIIGPERLPAAAESLRRALTRARGFAKTAQERVRDELGSEVADVDWQRLDPRQYDPRRIIREALLADPEPTVAPRAASTDADDPTPAAARQAESGPGDAPSARADTDRNTDSTRRTAA
jgi:sec-independent protein translocase protein TatB